jgi:hypothetical protein
MPCLQASTPRAVARCGAGSDQAIYLIYRDKEFGIGLIWALKRHFWGQKTLFKQKREWQYLFWLKAKIGNFSPEPDLPSPS